MLFRSAGAGDGFWAGPWRWDQPGLARWLLGYESHLLFSFCQELECFVVGDGLGFLPAAEGVDDSGPPRGQAAGDDAGGGGEPALSILTPTPPG